MKNTYVKAYDGQDLFWACNKWGDNNTHDFTRQRRLKQQKDFNPYTGKKL